VKARNDAGAAKDSMYTTNADSITMLGSVNAQFGETTNRWTWAASYTLVRSYTIPYSTARNSVNANQWDYLAAKEKSAYQAFASASDKPSGFTYWAVTTAAGGSNVTCYNQFDFKPCLEDYVWNLGIFNASPFVGTALSGNGFTTVGSVATFNAMVFTSSNTYMGNGVPFLPWFDNFVTTGAGSNSYTTSKVLDSSGNAVVYAQPLRDDANNVFYTMFPNMPYSSDSTNRPGALIYVPTGETINGNGTYQRMVRRGYTETAVTVSDTEPVDVP